jgi:hypothetical protein
MQNSELIKTAIQDDESETIVSLFRNEDNDHSRQINANSKHLSKKDIEAIRNE